MANNMLSSNDQKKEGSPSKTKSPPGKRNTKSPDSPKNVRSLSDNETDDPVRHIYSQEVSLENTLDLTSLHEGPTSRLSFAFEEIIGIHKMNSIQVNYLYKPYWLYLFEPNELQQLLGDPVGSEGYKKKKQKSYLMKFSPIIITNVTCQNGLIEDCEPIAIPFSNIPKLYFLSKYQLQDVISQSLQLTRENNKVKLKLDIDRVRIALKKCKPRSCRDEYHFANLNVKVFSIIQEQELERDTFTIQIRMPCIEVLSEVIEEQSIHESIVKMDNKVFKTTVAHFLTGS